jgi:hypothetical protein
VRAFLQAGGHPRAPAALEEAAGVFFPAVWNRLHLKIEI